MEKAKMVKLYRTRIAKQGFVIEEKHTSIFKYIAWGYFEDENGKRHRLAITDGGDNITYWTKQAARESIEHFRESFKNKTA